MTEEELKAAQEALEAQQQELITQKAALEAAQEELKQKLADMTPEEALKAQVDASLIPIKDSLDKAYAGRDEALRRIAEFEQKEKDATIARLQAEGKDKEAHDLQLAEEKARNEVLAKRNIELTRDIDVRQEMSALEFRNKKAQDGAFRDITSELVQKEDGQWVHNSGTSIKDYIVAFAADPENEFMFKPNINQGPGNPRINGPADLNAGKSVFALTQAEVLRRAEAGTLRTK
jgi:hypothetical protein